MGSSLTAPSLAAAPRPRRPRPREARRRHPAWPACRRYGSCEVRRVCRPMALSTLSTWRASRVRSLTPKGHLLNEDKPLGPRTPNRFASVVNIPTVVDTRRDPCSSSLSRSAPSRGGCKVDRYCTPCNSAACGPWYRGGRLPQIRRLRSPSDREPSPCRRTRDRGDYPPSWPPAPSKPPQAGCWVPRAREEPSERFSGVWLRRAQILLSRGSVVVALGVRVWSPTSRANPFLDTPIMTIYEIYKHLLGNNVEITVQIHRGVS